MKLNKLKFALLISVGISGLFQHGCSNIVGAVTGPQPITEPRDQRTLGSLVDDELIETKALVNIKKADPGFANSNIVVTSFNGVLLLAGQVSSENLKQIAAQTASQIRKVRKVHNEITVSGPISYVARSNDSWLTTKVKTQLIGLKGFPANKVKVVTENGTVYLMGLVSASQGEQAVNITRQTYGVQKIVKIFEYTN